MSQLKVILIVANAVVALLVIGCTRSSSESSRLILDLGNAKFTDSTVLMHVIVNVSGPGISPAINQKFSSDSTTMQPAPTEISLEVPTGKSRLIQIMGVYINTQTGAMHFVYGDKTADLNPGINSIELGVTSYGVSSVQGQVTGRYLRADGTAPTGKIAWKFSPTNGNPPMLIDYAEMFAGYFSVMAFEGVNTSYAFAADGEPIFTNVNLGSAVFAAADERAHVDIPNHFDERINGSSMSYVARSPKRIIYGFFGPGSTGKQACWHDSNRPFVGRLYSDPIGASPIAWLGSQGAPTAGVMRSTAGGIPRSSNSLCLIPDLVNQISLNPEKIQNSLESDLLTRGGPFLPFSSNGELIEASGSGSDLTISFQFRPGLFGNQKTISGVEFFSRPKSTGGNSNYGGMSDSISCSEFARAQSFQKIGETTLSQTTLTAANPAQTSVTNLDLLGCPFTQQSWGREFYSLRAATSNFLNSTNSSIPMMMFSKIRRDYAHSSHEYIRVEWMASNAQQVSYYRLWVSGNPDNVGPNEADLCGNASNVQANASFFDFDCINGFAGGNILSTQAPKYFKMQAFDAQNNPLGSQRIQQMLIVPNSGAPGFQRQVSEDVDYTILDFTANVAGNSGGVTFYKPVAPVGSSDLNCSLISSSGSLVPDSGEYWSPRWMSPCVFKAGEGATWSVLQFETNFKGIILQDLLAYTTN